MIAGLIIAFIILMILAVMGFLSPSNLYRMKIKKFKAERPEKYAFLPDSFPKGSSDREYFYLPNIFCINITGSIYTFCYLIDISRYARN